MSSRHDAREVALQVLYACDSTDNWTNDALTLYLQVFGNPEWSTNDVSNRNLSFVNSLVNGVLSSRELIDKTLTNASDRWSLARMSRVDRNILRLAAYELNSMPETPPNVVIDEAVELAKEFGTDDSPLFINGVLDRIAGEVRKAV